jgi:cytidylate kinase
MRAKGQVVDEEALAKDLAERDHCDFSRKVAPLKKAEDAVIIDSTNMSIDEVVAVLAQHINKRN